MKRFAAAISPVKLHLALILSGIGCVLISSLLWNKTIQFVPSTSHLEEHTTTELPPELIDQLLKLEQHSQFKQAISLIEQVRSSNPSVLPQLVAIKQRLSSQIYDRAMNEYRNGNVEKAIEIAEALPLDAPNRALLQQVQADWQRSRTILDLARTYQRQGRSTFALDLIQQLRDPVLQASQSVQSLKAEIQRSQSAAVIRPPLPVAEPEVDQTEVTESSDSWQNPPVAEEEAAEPSIAPESIPSESSSIEMAPTVARRALPIAPPERTPPVVSSSSKRQAMCDQPMCDFSGFSN